MHLNPAKMIVEIYLHTNTRDVSRKSSDLHQKKNVSTQEGTVLVNFYDVGCHSDR